MLRLLYTSYFLISLIVEKYLNFKFWHICLRSQHIAGIGNTTHKLRNSSLQVIITTTTGLRGHTVLALMTVTSSPISDELYGVRNVVRVKYRYISSYNLSF